MNEAIYQALCSCLGLVPSADEAVALIREAYQEPENAPRPPRHDGEFRLPLVLAQASAIFHSSCEGKLGIALE